MLPPERVFKVKHIKGAYKHIKGAYNSYETKYQVIGSNKENGDFKKKSFFHLSISQNTIGKRLFKQFAEQTQNHSQLLTDYPTLIKNFCFEISLLQFKFNYNFYKFNFIISKRDFLFYGLPEELKNSNFVEFRNIFFNRYIGK